MNIMKDPASQGLDERTLELLKLQQEIRKLEREAHEFEALKDDVERQEERIEELNVKIQRSDHDIESLRKKIGS
ncbi:hypothetical protein CAEBREN_22052 [Caenorhabditis brenneri]|uniref:Uncharacterized protein n=1 Tax=Caenorhabditis brenneri TaxID=135651 RepID=G0MDE5_CAEBE|nr:hypothetical protein CAEBREN_22052 [Caenorhabditis brenneri]